MQCAVEPLLSTEHRQIVEDRVIVELANHPTWAATWCGGVLADLAMTLPSTDLWRGISATITTQGPDGLHRGEHPPAQTGATLDGHPFGTFRDATDIVTPIFDEPSMDVAVAALVPDLDPHAAAMLAFAMSGWESSITASIAVWDALTIAAGPPAHSSEHDLAIHRLGIARHYFAVSAQALRWAIYRRRSYDPVDDLWPLESAWTWVARAARIVQSDPWSAGDLDRSLATERIAGAIIPD